jgi:hypothetical protein
MMAMLASGYLPIGYRLSRLGDRAIAIGLSAIGSGYWAVGLLMIGLLGYWRGPARSPSNRLDVGALV